MSRDWFDPFGLRGTPLDPLTHISGALKGEGIAGQSAGFMATAIARRLVGRRIEIDRSPPVSATVARVDEARPTSGLAALPTSGIDASMWDLVRGELTDVRVGPRRASRVGLEIRDVRLLGSTGRRIRVGKVGFDASVDAAEVVSWSESFEGGHRLRVHEGRIEITDRRLTRWVWVEIDVTATNRKVTVTPQATRVFGRELPRMVGLFRPVTRHAPWLPQSAVIEEVRVDGGIVRITGHLTDIVLPVDASRVLTEIGVEGTRSVLRIVLGEW